MTAEELTQFKALAKKYEAKDKDEVLGVLKADVHEVFQDINDGGRRAANEANKTKMDSLEAKVTTAEAAKVAAEKKVTELNGQAPDAARLKETYDRSIADLQSTHKTELEAKDGVILTERISNAKKELVTALVKAGIDEEYASTIMVEKAEVRDRLKPGQDGKIQIMKSGSDLPLVPPGGDKTIYNLLAEELAPTVTDRWKTSKVKRGSGNTGSEGGADDQGATTFDEIRTEVKERVESRQKSRDKSVSGLDRLRSGRR